MPSARFWPDQKLPAGLDISTDYERHVHGVTRLHDAGWHKAHGYVWHGGAWVHEIEVRGARNRADAIEEYNVAKRLAGLAQAATRYGPQPLADVEDHLMAAE